MNSGVNLCTHRRRSRDQPRSPALTAVPRHRDRTARSAGTSAPRPRSPRAGSGSQRVQTTTVSSSRDHQSSLALAPAGRRQRNRATPCARPAPRAPGACHRRRHCASSYRAAPPASPSATDPEVARVVLPASNASTSAARYRQCPPSVRIADSRPAFAHRVTSGINPKHRGHSPPESADHPPGRRARHRRTSRVSASTFARGLCRAGVPIHRPNHRKPRDRPSTADLPSPSSTITRAGPRRPTYRCRASARRSTLGWRLNARRVQPGRRAPRSSRRSAASNCVPAPRSAVNRSAAYSPRRSGQRVGNRAEHRAQRDRGQHRPGRHLTLLNALHHRDTNRRHRHHTQQAHRLPPPHRGQPDTDHQPRRHTPTAAPATSTPTRTGWPGSHDDPARAPAAPPSRHCPAAVPEIPEARRW